MLWKTQKWKKSRVAFDHQHTAILATRVNCNRSNWIEQGTWNQYFQIIIYRTICARVPEKVPMKYCKVLNSTLVPSRSPDILVAKYFFGYSALSTLSRVEITTETCYKTGKFNYWVFIEQNLAETEKVFKKRKLYDTIREFRLG